MVAFSPSLPLLLLLLLLLLILTGDVELQVVRRGRQVPEPALERRDGHGGPGQSRQQDRGRLSLARAAVERGADEPLDEVGVEGRGAELGQGRGGLGDVAGVEILVDEGAEAFLFFFFEGGRRERERERKEREHFCLFVEVSSSREKTLRKSERERERERE